MTDDEEFRDALLTIRRLLDELQTMKPAIHAQVMREMESALADLHGERTKESFELYVDRLHRILIWAMTTVSADLN
jgi:hypothetical protein